MTNNELFRLNAGLQSVGNLKGVKFCYAVAKNLRKVSALCEDLRAGVKPSDEYQEFLKEREALAKKYVAKDEDDNPIMQGGGFKIADPISFEKVLEPIREKFAEAIAEQEAKEEDLEKLLEEEADIRLYTIAFELVPEDISAAQLSGIFEIIDDPVE